MEWLTEEAYFLVWPRNKKVIDALDDLHISKNKKSSKEQGKTEGNTDGLFDIKCFFIIEWVRNTT